MLKGKVPVWGLCSLVLAISAGIACATCYTLHNIVSSTKSTYCLLSNSDINNLDNSIETLFKGDTKTITVGIIGNGHTDKKDYDDEIKKYCDEFGIKTHFMHTDTIDAVILKR